AVVIATRAVGVEAGDRTDRLDHAELPGPRRGLDLLRVTDAPAAQPGRLAPALAGIDIKALQRKALQVDAVRRRESRHSSRHSSNPYNQHTDRRHLSTVAAVRST